MYAAAIPLGEDKPAATAPSGAMVDSMRRFARLVGTADRRPRLLDFGSGAGRWSLAAAQAGFDVVAFEPNAGRVAIDDPSIEQVYRWKDLGGRSFDAIQIEQVLEHLPDPHKVLRELRPMCRQGALIRISVPNVARDPDAGRLWETWPFNGHAPHVMAPYEHLHGYCTRSLDALIERTGLVPLPLHSELTTRPLDVLRRLLGPLLPPISSTERFVTAAAR
jgi:SAM-dependent methyltransferase